VRGGGWARRQALSPGAAADPFDVEFRASGAVGLAGVVVVLVTGAAAVFVAAAFLGVGVSGIGVPEVVSEVVFEGVAVCVVGVAVPERGAAGAAAVRVAAVFLAAGAFFATGAFFPTGASFPTGVFLAAGAFFATVALLGAGAFFAAGGRTGAGASVGDDDAAGTPAAPFVVGPPDGAEGVGASRAGRTSGAGVVPVSTSEAVRAAAALISRGPAVMRVFVNSRWSASIWAAKSNASSTDFRTSDSRVGGRRSASVSARAASSQARMAAVNTWCPRRVSSANCSLASVMSHPSGSDAGRRAG
jgi:hypothetical protein